jgi:hypothetical protein
MTEITENELLTYLQGHWEPADSGPGFEILKRNVLVNGSIRGIGFPGLDNAPPRQLILKWNTDINMWQIFIPDLSWFLTFIDEVSEKHFTIRHYDEASGELGEATIINRNG